MAIAKLPDPALLRKFISYDPETGSLTWQARTPEDFAGLVKPGSTRGALWRASSWNARFVGKAAGGLSADGYHRVAVFNNKHLAHRVAWAITYGVWPTEIDHIDGDRANNRLANLREVTRTENNKNQALQRNNTSGVPGVTWCKSAQSWDVRIKAEGRVYTLGRHKDFADAVAARKAGELRFGFHANHGRTQC